jgi:hypothetical protein
MDVVEAHRSLRTDQDAIYVDYVELRGGCHGLHDFDQPLDGVPAT